MSVSGIGSSSGFDLSKMASNIASKTVKTLDTDKDGSVSKTEFVSGASAKGISADDASPRFDKMDTKKTGSLTQADIESAIKSSAPNGAPPAGGKGAPPAGGGGSGGAGSATSSASSSSSKIYDKADANKDGEVTALEELVYSLKHVDDTSNSSTTSSASSLGTTVDVQA